MTDPTSLPNFPPPPDEHPLRGRVLDVLVDLGLPPNLDNDGDVAFTVNEQQLFVRCTEGEVEIMRVFGQWQIQDDLLGDRLKLHETCNELNLNMNCVKTGVAGSTLVVIGEHLVTPGADVSTLVQVSIQVILSGVHIWHQRVLGLDPTARGRRTGRRPVMTDLVRLEVEDGIGTIRLDRPPMNALNAEIQHGLIAACREAAERRDVSAVIVWGGEKVFAAGADIKEMETMSYTDMVDHSALLQDFTRALARLPKPTVAAITGYALGGGCEVALACDFRIAADDARLGQPEILLGIIPGAGGTQRLARLVGPSKAKDLVFSGRFVTAARGARDRARGCRGARRRRLRHRPLDDGPLRRWPGLRAACGQGGHRPRPRGRPRQRPGDRADAVRRPVRHQGPGHRHAALRREGQGPGAVRGRLTDPAAVSGPGPCPAGPGPAPPGTAAPEPSLPGLGCGVAPLSAPREGRPRRSCR